MQCLVFFCIFSHIVSPENVRVIYYSWEALLDIRATVTHQHYQHYDLQYNFPQADPLFAPPRAIELIPEADPKQKRGTRRVLLVQFRRRAHDTPLQSILFDNVQSLINNMDEFKARISFQRDIRDCNILCFTETWLSRDILSELVQQSAFSVHRTDSNKHLAWKKKDGDVCLMINKK